MVSQSVKKILKDWTRRTFLKTVGAAVPSLALLAEGPAAGSDQTAASTLEYNRQKFTPIDLARYFNATPFECGTYLKGGLVRVPTGNQTFRGIPFLLGPEGVHEKAWEVLSTRTVSWASKSVEIRLGQRAGFICLAAFCDWDENEAPPPGASVAERVGQQLANAVLIYEDGSEKAFPIRRRFEVNSPSYSWGHLSYSSLPHCLDRSRKLSDALSDPANWGRLQQAILSSAYEKSPVGTLWVCAVQNPAPERQLKTLRLEAKADDPLVVCGLTLFRGLGNPLRFDRLSLYRITLPEPAAEEEERWKIDIDLGIVARRYVLSDFDSEAWLVGPAAGLGEQAQPVRNGRHLYVELTASPDATLILTDAKAGNHYEFDIGKIAPGKELEARLQHARVEILEREKVWLHVQVVDSGTGHPTPVRLAFRSKEGRYIPPYGHRMEINDAWFEDYGADVKLMDTSFAYVYGTFQVELPVGEVFVEMTKGFEYSVVRKKLEIEHSQRELRLEISRHADFRSKGWVTADTNVHFLSPSTAILEGQSEGLNLISLLAAQWGDLFTNVGDLHYGPLISHDGETTVQVSTENRQHILGHLGLVGGHGIPAHPMSADGPDESYIGDPLWTSLADWADAQRKREGLVVAVHFPYPTAELAADIVLGKIDAVELYPYTEYFNTVRYLDWYRYLNCGYRLPAVGGTDKMGAYMPVGANRTYAYLGQEEFNFQNWARAVRQGNTFATTGPLLLFHADGQTPGSEITLVAGGGSVEVRVEGKSFVPFHRLEVVLNGRVVASREDKGGAREMILNEKVQVSGPGWLAARCASQLGPTTSWNLSVAAHTSPVYVLAPGQELFFAPDAAYMLTLIEGTQTWVNTLATLPDQERLERIRKVLNDAHSLLHRRLHERGVPH